MNEGHGSLSKVPLIVGKSKVPRYVRRCTSSLVPSFFALITKLVAPANQAPNIVSSILTVRIRIVAYSHVKILETIFELVSKAARAWLHVPRSFEDATWFLPWGEISGKVSLML